MMQERKLYVFGGWDTPVCYNDMYMLDLGEHNYLRKSKKTHVYQMWMSQQFPVLNNKAGFGRICLI